MARRGPLAVKPWGDSGRRPARAARFTALDATASHDLDDVGSCGLLTDDDVTVTDHTFTLPVILEACRTLTARDGLEVGAGGDVTLRAGETVILGDGFSVGAGGGLTVVIDPSLAPAP